MRVLFCAAAVVLAGTTPAALSPVHAASQGENTPCYGTTRDWRAWIEPGPRELELVVTGVVTTPTGGSWNVLTLGPTPWDEPSRQIVKLEIRAMGDIVTSAVTTEEVQARFRLPPVFGGQPRSGLVIIECQGKEVGRVQAVSRPNRSAATQ